MHIDPDELKRSSYNTDSRGIYLKRYFGWPNPQTEKDIRYMQHELAHFIYYQTHPGLIPGGYILDSVHYYCRPELLQVAMEEGWAEFVSGLVPDQDPNSNYLTGPGGCGEGNLETNNWHLNHPNKGDRYEGVIASYLYDLVDDPPGGDDDPFSIPFASLFYKFDLPDFNFGDKFIVLIYSWLLLQPPSTIPQNMMADFCTMLEKYNFYLKLGTVDLTQYCNDPTGVTWSQEETVELPKEFSIEQNYPNPFNSNTQLRLQIPVRGDVCIAVFNLLGQQVFESEMTDVSPGVHTVTIELPNAATGVYFVTASQNDRTKTLKMLYIK